MTRSARAHARTSVHSAALAAEEEDLAFFGACDSRAHLFLLAVTLRSVARFHRAAGFFVLTPHGMRAPWAPLLHAWTNGSAHIIELDSANEAEFARVGSAYSSMTFHRLHMPELLAARGYAYSVNLDPDILCTGRWDLTLFPQVRFLAGRPVRTDDDGVVTWVRERGAKDLNRTLSGLGISLQSLRWELNGGVLVFNNVRCVRVQLARLCSRFFGKLRNVVEGDQDLLSIVLAANPGFPVFKLPTQYNFAFQRDREAVPDALGLRLRLALYGQLTCVHFVIDGKPWEQQAMPPKDYPPWLVTARIYHLREWLSLARTLRPRPAALLTSQAERRTIGRATLRALSRPVPSPTRLQASAAHRQLALPAEQLDADALATCRCFLRQLSSSAAGDPLHAFRSEEQTNGTLLPAERIASRRSWYHRQRTIALALRSELLNDCETALARASGMGTGSCDANLLARAPSAQHPHSSASPKDPGARSVSRNSRRRSASSRRADRDTTGSPG